MKANGIKQTAVMNGVEHNSAMSLFGVSFYLPEMTTRLVVIETATESQVLTNEILL